MVVLSTLRKALRANCFCILPNAKRLSTSSSSFVKYQRVHPASLSTLQRCRFTTLTLRNQTRLPYSSQFHDQKRFLSQQSSSASVDNDNAYESETNEYAPDPEIRDRCTVSLTIKDYPGALANILQILSENNINMTRIESRYGQNPTQVQFFIDLDVPPQHRRVNAALNDLKKHARHVQADKVPAIKVPWFPITAQEVDSVALLVLDGGTDLEADHPGFHDADYKQRRAAVTQGASNFQFGDTPMVVDYSSDEIECWNTIWRRLKPLLYEHGCPQYIEAFEELQKHCGYKEGNLPQLADVSGFLYERTGFRLRPTAGLLSSRHFLNGLAFNTFFCTQYLRHYSVPFYTPEPDVVHELVGHAPMFANPEFAAFSQEIGLASIGATDAQIEQLARCYWFTVEFGICKESATSKQRKIYGAGILSSYGEIEHAMSDEPEIRKWDPRDAAQQPFPITKYQPLYYLADSFDDATFKMRQFANSLDKPFTCRWNDLKEKLYVDRNVQREDRREDDFGEYVGDA